MRREQFRTFSDGAIGYGNGIIGPTPQDIKRFNSFSLEDVGNRLPQDGLVTFKSESRLGEFLKLAFGKLPKRAILPAAGVLSALSIAATCSPKDNSDESPTTIVRGTQAPSKRS